MALLTKLGTCAWEVVRNSLEAYVWCSRQFLFYIKKKAKPLSKKAATTLRKKKKKTFNPSRIWPVNFSSLSSYSNYIHPSAIYLPPSAELRFRDSSDGVY